MRFAVCSRRYSGHGIPGGPRRMESLGEGLTFACIPVISSVMRPVHWIAPAIALVIAGGLVGTQRQKISRLENESDVLRKHISAEKVRIEIERIAEVPARPVMTGRTDEAIDWVEIAAVFGEISRGGGVGDMRKMMSFQAKLQKMDKDQLLAALDRIQALELADDERMILETLLIGPLAQKDPELLLNRFSGRLDDEDSGIAWQLAAALGEWAKDDRAAASAWFDREIAAGTFDSKSLDGKSRIRLQFESNLMAQLISSDPTAVDARIAALPADHRKDALGGFAFQRLSGDDQAAYADLVRANLSEEEQHEIFGQQASMLAMTGDLEKVDAYLDGIGAAGEERIHAAERAAGSSLNRIAHRSKITEENIDSMREWLGSQAPDSVDRITGESLARIGMMGGGTNFPETAAMVMKYHEQGGGDDILTAFLENSRHRGDKDRAREIAERISDPEKRAEALEKLK